MVGQWPEGSWIAAIELRTENSRPLHPSMLLLSLSFRCDDNMAFEWRSRRSKADERTGQLDVKKKIWTLISRNSSFRSFLVDVVFRYELRMSRCQQSCFVSLWSLRPDPHILDFLTLRSLWNTSEACRAGLTTTSHNFSILWLIQTMCHLVMPRLYPMPEAFGLHDNWISVKCEKSLYWSDIRQSSKHQSKQTCSKLKVTSRALKRRHPADFFSSLTLESFRIHKSISMSFSKTRATRG